MGTDCKSAAFSFGGSNPPAPTKRTSVEITLVFCFARHPKSHSRGWIRTAAATSLEMAQKRPGGLFLAARLATSTRAHQKTSTYESTLRFLFCCKARLTGRVDSNSCGDIAEDGAKTARWAFLDARLATSTRAHQKSSSVFSTLELFVLLVREAHKCRWIRTAAAMSLKTAQKQPRWTVRFTGAAAIP